jgi:hypothetical protein
MRRRTYKFNFCVKHASYELLKIDIGFRVGKKHKTIYWHVRFYRYNIHKCDTHIYMVPNTLQDIIISVNTIYLCAYSEYQQYATAKMDGIPTKQIE